MFYKFPYFANGFGDFIIIIYWLLTVDDNSTKEELNVVVPFIPTHLKNGTDIETGISFILSMFDTNVKRINLIQETYDVTVKIPSYYQYVGSRFKYEYDSSSNIVCYSIMTGESDSPKRIPPFVLNAFFDMCKKLNVIPICIDAPMKFDDAIKVLLASKGLFTVHSGWTVIAYHIKIPQCVYIQTHITIPSVNVDEWVKQQVCHEINDIINLNKIESMITNGKIICKNDLNEIHMDSGNKPKSRHLNITQSISKT
jgi:hypothetical protein